MFLRVLPFIVISFVFLFVFIVVVDSRLGLNLLESYSRIATEDQLDKLIKLTNFIIEILEHLLPLSVSALFGMLGAFTKNLINDRYDDLTLQALTKVYSTKKQLLKDKDENILLEYQARNELQKTDRKNNLTLGTIFGIIGYLLLSSHFIVKILYPKIDIAKFEVSFLAVAIVGIGFGFFARELAGFSKRVVENRIESFLQVEKATENKRKGTNK